MSPPTHQTTTSASRSGAGARPHRISKRRGLVTLIAALAAVATMALPAAAHVSPTVVVFSGTLSTPDLTYPVVGVGNSGGWSFVSQHNSTGVPGDCISVVAHTGIGCSISASGEMGDVAYLGAWCGLSAATGSGSYTASDGSTTDITSISWVASAGSILPLTGTWADTHGSGTSGVIVGAFLAVGLDNDGGSIDHVQSCASSSYDGGGFDVIGVASFM